MLFDNKDNPIHNTKMNSQDMKQTTDFTKNGACSRCGGCCSSVIPATDAEIKTCKDYAVSHGFTPSLPDDRNLVYLQCPYLEKHRDGTTSCAVYAVRPSICRVFKCSMSPGEGVQAFLAANGDPDADPVNMWEAWGRTGIRLDGTEITSANAAQASMLLDDGRSLCLRQGQAVRPVQYAGTPMSTGIILALTRDGFFFTNGPTGVLELKYEDLDNIVT